MKTPQLPEGFGVVRCVVGSPWNRQRVIWRCAKRNAVEILYCVHYHRSEDAAVRCAIRWSKGTPTIVTKGQPAQSSPKGT